MPRIRPNPPPQEARVDPEPPEPEPLPPKQEFDVDKLTAMLDQPAETPPPQPDPVTQTAEPAAGSPEVTASVSMSANELDLLRARLARCWSPPIGWVDPAEVRVVLLLALNVDGSVNGQPQVLEAPQGQFSRQAPESALRAVRRCAPYILPAEKYDAWREVKVTFDPQDMGQL
jgi:colicin import membrane protein